MMMKSQNSDLKISPILNVTTMFSNEAGKLMSLVSQTNINGFKKVNKLFVTDVHIHEMDKNGTEFKLSCTSEKSLGDKFILNALRFHNITISDYHNVFDKLEIHIEVSGHEYTMCYKKFVIEHLNKLNTPSGRPYLAQVGNDVVLMIPWETMFHGDLTDQISDTVKITLLVRLKSEIDCVSAMFRFTVFDFKSIELEKLATNWVIGVTDIYYFNTSTDEHSELSFNLNIDSPLQGLILRFDDMYEHNLNSMDIYFNGHQYCCVLMNELDIRHLMMDGMMPSYESNIVDYFFIPLADMNGYVGCPNMSRIENSKLRLSLTDYACRNVEIVALAFNVLTTHGFRFATLGNKYSDIPYIAFKGVVEEVNDEDEIMVIEI